MKLSRLPGSALLAWALMIWTVGAAAGKTLYVDARASGLENGSSWGDACVRLQDALAEAASGGRPVEIRVARGTYRPDQGASQIPGSVHEAFELLDGVSLRGGYAGPGTADPNTRDIPAHPTILSGDLQSDDEPNFANYGDNSQVVVRSTFNEATAVLDGFTIASGHGWSRPAISCYGSDATFTNCTLVNNKAAGREGGFGGGMYVSGRAPTLLRRSSSGIMRR